MHLVVPGTLCDFHGAFRQWRASGRMSPQSLSWNPMQSFLKIVEFTTQPCPVESVACSSLTRRILLDERILTVFLLRGIMNYNTDSALIIIIKNKLGAHVGESAAKRISHCTAAASCAVIRDAGPATFYKILIFMEICSEIVSIAWFRPIFSELAPWFAACSRFRNMYAHSVAASLLYSYLNIYWLSRFVF